MSTVNCHEARALLMAYLDSELDTATVVSVREHLQGCPRCATRFEQEERLERALGRVLQEGEMPEDVHGRLNQALSILAAELASSAEDDGADAPAASGQEPAPVLEARSDAPSKRPARLTWMRWLAAAVVLLSAALYLSDEGEQRPASPADFLGGFVSAWESTAGLTELPAVQEPREIRSLLDQHAFSAFEFPADGRVHDHAVKLLGAREEAFNGVRAVNVIYDCCGVVTSVFVLPTRGLDALPGGLETVEALRSGSADLKVKGVHTRTVIRDELLIGVVSRHASGLAQQWVASS